MSHVLETLIAESTRLAIARILGGFGGGWFSTRTYRAHLRAQIRIQGSLRRRDALLDLLNVLPSILSAIRLDWQLPQGWEETAEQFIRRAQDQVTRLRGLFLGGTAFSATIEQIQGLIGTPRESFFHEGASPPGETYVRLPNIIEEKAVELEK